MSLFVFWEPLEVGEESKRSRLRVPKLGKRFKDRLLVWQGTRNLDLLLAHAPFHIFVFLSKVDDECLEAVGLNPE